MRPDDFCTLYPELYHMAESNALPSILDHGLLSTSSLLDLFEVNGLVRIRLEGRVRRQSEKITHPQYGSAVIRDQKPIVNETRLAKCLQGATPEEWLRLLNSKVFFWLDRARLDRLRSARAYRQQKHLILTLNTRKVVDDYSAQITLCAMNWKIVFPIRIIEVRRRFRQSRILTMTCGAGNVADVRSLSNARWIAGFAMSENIY